MGPLDRRQFLVGTAGGALWASTGRCPGGSDTFQLLRLPAEPSGISKRALRELRAAVKGRVLVPRGSASLVYNTRFEGRRPDAVVQVRDTADVAAAVRWANRFDVRVVARSGGHSYAGYCTTGDGVVLDLSRLRGIRVSRGRATVGPAAQLIDVQRALTRRGVTVPSGSCPTVGIAGLALGGGHGLAGRRFGLTSDNLLAARVVTADGRVRHVDADTNEDLFWALRGGGGGNFGVVTSLTLRTHRAAGAAYFLVSWPWSQAGEAIAAWQRVAPGAGASRACRRSASTSARSPPCGGWSGRSPEWPVRASRPAARATSRWFSAGRAAWTAACPRATARRARASTRSPTTSRSRWARAGAPR